MRIYSYKARKDTNIGFESFISKIVSAIEQSWSHALGARPQPRWFDVPKKPGAIPPNIASACQYNGNSTVFFIRCLLQEFDLKVTETHVGAMQAKMSQPTGNIDIASGRDVGYRGPT